MKIKINETPVRINIKNIKDELKNNLVEKFEYGDFDNWVTALIRNMEVVEIRKIQNPWSGKRYAVDVKTNFDYIDYQGNVSTAANTGYQTYYVDDPEDFELGDFYYSEVIE